MASTEVKPAMNSTLSTILVFSILILIFLALILAFTSPMRRMAHRTPYGMNRGPRGGRPKFSIQFGGNH